jgi:transposase InsO family protein
MTVRRLNLEVHLDGLNVREFCRLHGISTWFFYDLRRRFAAGGYEAIESRSRAPRHVANRTSDDVEDRVVAMRKELVELGVDAGPGTIWFHLNRRAEGPVPSEATIWRVLDRRGFVTKDPRKAPKRKARSFSAERANECWQIDDTPWPLASGTTVKIINVIDDCTRLVVASVAVPACTSEAAFDACARGAQDWGWPARFLSDNARAFRHGLADALRELGIAAGHSRPYHPQTCGKVERFHQTLKDHLATRPAVGSVEDLQAQLDWFRDYYNHQRPHRSLHRQIPAQVWTATPKDGPAADRIDAETRIHRGVVHNGGVSAGAHQNIAVGAAHNGAAAVVVLTGLNAHVFIEGRLVRALTMDPARTYQSLYDKPGKPPTVRDVPRHP